MHRTQSEFCLQEAERLLQLATECEDPILRDKIATMAKEWMQRGMELKGFAALRGASTEKVSKRH
jgi:hypothetical protein